MSAQRPSTALSILIFVLATAAMAVLRLWIFEDRFLTLSYGLFLLPCLWHRDRRLLWAMAAAFAGLAVLKVLEVYPADDPRPGYAALQLSTQLIDIAVIAATVHLILNLTARLRARNEELTQANEELQAREEEISRQNEELRNQAEELQQQTEELQQQTEEIQQQTEELGQQSEDLQAVNAELGERQRMLQTLLESVSAAKNDREVLGHICRSLLDLLQVAGGAAVLEASGEDLWVRAHSGFPASVAERLPRGKCFAAIVLEEGRTAFVDDLQARPDLLVPASPHHAFRSVLSTPFRLGGAPAGTVEVYAAVPRRWTAEEFRVIEWVAAKCSLILEVRRLHDQLTAANANLECQVKERTSELEQLVDELEHFSYTITHDLRAPLRAMQGFSALLEEQCAASLDEESKDYLHRISTAAERMDRLITDALHYSRLVREEIPTSVVDPGPLLRGMIESYPAFQPPRAHIAIDGELPPVLANKAGLTQCFSNLLDNAVKFVEAGIVPRVRISAERDGGLVRLCFEDNGIGIPPEMMPRMFRMFQRASKDYPGTGIGLALVRKVAERMGGRAGVVSEPGRGSRFWIELKHG